MSETNVLVLVDDKTERSSELIVKSVEEHGVRVERLLRGSRTIVGAAASQDAINRVRGLEGVASVRQEGVISHPPMDPKIPQ